MRNRWVNGSLRLMLVVGLSYMLGMSIYAFNQWRDIKDAQQEIAIRQVALTIGPQFSLDERIHLSKLAQQQTPRLSPTELVLMNKQMSVDSLHYEIGGYENYIRKTKANLSRSVYYSLFPFLLIVIASIIWWVIRGFKARPTIPNPAL